METYPSNSPAVTAKLAGGMPAAPRKSAGSTPLRRWKWLQIGHEQGFEWNHLDLAVPELPPDLENLRLLHLSDSHLKERWSSTYDRFFERLDRDPPDLLLFSGDLVDDKLDHRKALHVAQRFVSRLRARLGVYGITGNHDGDLIGPRMGAWSMRFINRMYVRLEDRSAIELIGLPGVRRTSFDPEWLSQLPVHQPGVPRIVLGHYPDQVRHIGSLKADLMLSGHTHGGQICLPNGRALMTHDTLPKRMARGAHKFGTTTLVVSRGFGTTRWPIRFFCPAEVVEIRLVRAPATK